MSLESAIADLVSASTSLVSAVNVTKTTIEATEAAAAAQVQPTAAAATEAQTQASAAATSASTVSSKLTTAAADYAAQKVTKGLAAVQTAADTELKDRLHRRDPARYPFRGARPSLVMDFVRQECHRNNAAGNLEPVDLNSFMTFTRASTATVVGPDGLIKEVASNVPRYGYDPVTGEALGLLIEEQRTNLLTYSSDFLGWVAEGVTVHANVSTSPNGTLTATKLIAASTTGYHLIRKPNYLVAAGKTFTVYAKKCEYTGVLLSASNTPFPANEVVVSLVNGSVISTGTMVSGVVVTPFADGWFRISVQYSSLEDTLWNIGVCDGSSRSFTGNNTSGIYIWGAQIEAGSFPTSYIPTPATFTSRASTATYLDSNGVLQTAASGVARSNAYGYDNDGVLRPIGLLLEGAATNLWLNSNTVNASWSLGNITTTYGPATPYGSTSSKVVVDAGVSTVGNDGAGRFAAISIATGSAITYTGSFLAKAGECDYVLLREARETGARAKVNLITGTVSNDLNWTPETFSVTTIPLKDGWWRICFTRTDPVIFSFNLKPCPVVGDGVSGVYIACLQVEQGSYATSYIPTTTAQVTRAADTSTSAQVTRGDETANISTMSNWYNADNSTFLAAAQRPVSVSSNTRVLSASDSTNGEILGICPDGVTVESYNGTSMVSTSAGVLGGVLRGALCVGRANRRIALNGGGVISNLVTTNIVGVSTVKIYPYTVAQPRAGYIRSFTYFPRQLSDADLQALTILEN